MITTRIETFSGKFTQTEQKIAGYILQNPYIIKNMTSTELSKELNISQSNIIRFVKKIGYKGYREFLLDVAIEEKYMDNDINLTENDNADLVTKKITQRYIDVIQTTSNLINYEDLNSAVNYITKARRVLVFGIGSSLLMAECFTNNISKIGINVTLSSNVHIAFSVASIMNPNDVVILFSQSGETSDVIQLASIAKTNNIPIIGIARYGKNRLRQISTVCLNTFDSADNSRIDITVARSSQLYIVDLLYTLILQSNYDYYIKMIENTEKTINKNRTHS